MLRELELASGRWAHIISHLLGWPYGEPVVAGPEERPHSESLTMRSLRCACRVRVHPLCPLHAARRHIARLRAQPCMEQTDFPLVPTSVGKVPTKHVMVHFFRRTIAATGTPTTRLNADGTETERFSSHLLRVSGAQWLSRMGMGGHQIQLLGRWSSAAVERYIQLAPLLQVERTAGEMLNPESRAHRQVRQGDLVRAG